MTPVCPVAPVTPVKPLAPASDGIHWHDHRSLELITHLQGIWLDNAQCARCGVHPPVTPVCPVAPVTPVKPLAPASDGIHWHDHRSLELITHLQGIWLDNAQCARCGVHPPVTPVCPVAPVTPVKPLAPASDGTHWHNHRSLELITHLQGIWLDNAQCARCGVHPPVTPVCPVAPVTPVKPLAPASDGIHWHNHR